MNRLINEELDKMKYLLGYQRGMVISEQAQVTTPAAAPAVTVDGLVKELQTILNTQYGAKLAVDGKWGNLTQTAFETAVKSKAAAPKDAPASPASSGTTLPTVTVTGATAPAPAIAAAPSVPLPSVNTPAAPGVSTQPAPVAPTTAPVAPSSENPEDIVGTEVAQPTRRDQRRERQDLRRSNRRAMQDLRTQQRAQ